MSDGTKSSNGDSKQIEVVEVDNIEDVDLELGATMFDVNDAKQKLNSKEEESRLVDGEIVLESLADDSQIIHVKSGKIVDSKTKSAKKTAKSKKEDASEKAEDKKGKEDKESR